MNIDTEYKTISAEQSAPDTHRLTGLAIIIIISLFLSACLALPLLLQTGANADVSLDSKVNPNTASAASLSRLPGIGPAKANLIISYRQSIKDNNPAARAFIDSNDLQKVTGLGPKTAERIKKYLKFN